MLIKYHTVCCARGVWSAVSWWTRVQT